MTTKTFSGTVTVTFDKMGEFEKFQSSIDQFMKSIPGSVKFGQPQEVAPLAVAMTVSSKYGRSAVSAAFGEAYHSSVGMSEGPALVFADGTETKNATSPPYVLSLASGSLSTQSSTDKTPAAIIGNQLVVSGKSVTQDQLSAVANCILYAQAAIRAQLKGVSEASREFFDAEVKELSGLGFTVSRTSNTEVISNVKSISSALSEAASSFLKADELNAFDAIQEALISSSAPPETLQYLKSWWASGSKNDSASVINWGMVTLENGQPTFTLLFLAFSRKVTPDENDARSLSLSSFAVTLGLEMSIYQKEEASLMEMLGKEAQKHIQSVDLNL